jgi:septum formation protein
MLLKKLKKYKIVLASGSPRRHALLKEMGLEFEVTTRPVNEVYPPGMKCAEIARFLSRLKAEAFDEGFFANDTLLITADTIVCLDGRVMEKPENSEAAAQTLALLSGRMHEVITGVTIKDRNKEVNFEVCTDVYFKELQKDEIMEYVESCKPFDKAGAYGIQEWIGYIGIERIEGSFYNVMGMPTQRLYEELLKF